ncbi:MAG TPA: MalY/PatB family protein [Methylomusa anaerophila]|uniref:cysteine-S-conjugate beta-lyase n=1 Tax=Methylomusa anaerophila TaxID=1930071 RepID=A0A348AET2_9FIRM|nr:MalY/PatB family protein [Methylomusa anaerophila]BBB89580.1 cystathionine beta-lyase PatB [Methylomusa anaerophila]HML89646.1 MalY/PatB family protein [Methylomusa anaerophila]
MSRNFDEIINRKNTWSLKWDFNFQQHDILPMSIADMDFYSPKAVENAIIERAKHGLYGYVGVPDTFKKIIKSWINRRHEWDIDEEWLLYSYTVTASIRNIIPAFTDPGDKILILTPCYGSFSYSITLNNRELVTSPLILQENYAIDFDDFEKKLSEGVKLFILCSPHNPIGKVWTKDELLKLGELCMLYNVLIISDEIHSDIVFKGYKHIPIASLSFELAQNSITFMSAGKTFNLSGLGASYIIAPNSALREKFKKQLKLTGVHEPNIFGIVAAEVAYSYGQQWLEAVLDYLQNNYDFMSKFFSEKIPEIRAVNQEGTYLGWLDCRKINIDCNELNDFFTNKARVKLNDGKAFGENGTGFQRINFACSRVILIEALNRIQLAVNKISI